MADKKISQLSSASLPLAGTEVLPIVQSSATVKVSADDLTVKNIRSNATTGILQVVGPAAASTRVMTTPDANFTAARTDAAQSFTGDQTLSDGNLVIGTSGKGIDFSATPGTGTSELFADYEEGTWTSTLTTDATGPTTPVTRTSRYTKIGRMVYVSATFSGVNTTGASGNILITGLPFTCLNDQQARSYGPVMISNIDLSAGYSYAVARVNSNATTISVFECGDNVANQNLALTAVSSVVVNVSFCYEAA